MDKKTLSVSILMPVYNGSAYLKEALDSIFRQDFPFYELIIIDDNKPTSIDEIRKTKEIISRFKDKRTTLIKNEKNLGSQQTIRKLAGAAKGEILFYLCQDDVLSKNSLQKTHDAFFLGSDIGAVTRPYFWFEEDISKPVRSINPPDNQNDSVLSVFDGEQTVRTIFDSLGQLSGLAYRKSMIDIPFHTDVFPGHIYPFAGILKKHKCVYLKDFTVAVRIQSSQSRTLSTIYDTSPLAQWVAMFKTVYKEKEYSSVRQWGIRHIATHYVGFVQIKNFGNTKALLQEIMNTIHFYPKSVFDIKFWFYAFLTVLLPRPLLLQLSDTYKRKVLATKIGTIEFNY